MNETCKKMNLESEKKFKFMCQQLENFIKESDTTNLQINILKTEIIDLKKSLKKITGESQSTLLQYFSKEFKSQN